MKVLNFFQVQKLIFGHFWNCKKWNLAKNFFVKLIYLISWLFLAWTFFNFLAHCACFWGKSKKVTQIQINWVHLYKSTKMYHFNFIQKSHILSRGIFLMNFELYYIHQWVYTNADKFNLSKVKKSLWSFTKVKEFGWIRLDWTITSVEKIIKKLNYLYLKHTDQCFSSMSSSNCIVGQKI